ncbi:MAG: hypothetical protein KHY44_13640 [Clostridiales bacterium]|jgi:hypothetical protein|nr:hypothetical protein [Clostridiales bacterium]
MKNKLLATLLMGVSIISVGCQKEDIGSGEKIEQLTQKPIVTEQNKEGKEDELSKDNSSAKEIKVSAGTFEVGVDVPVGRYVCTGSGNGNLSIYDGELQIVDEMIDSTNEVGVASVTIDLYEGQKIEVSGLDELVLTPAKTLVRTSLTTGNWIVGLDIQPGRYIVEPVLEGLLKGKGSLLVYDNEIPVVNEYLDASGEIGVKLAIIELKDGQTISISGVPEVKFTVE